MAEIRAGDHEVLLAVPYWAWQEQVATLLAAHKDDPELRFTWSLLRDVLRNCQYLVSGTAIEIVSYHPPIEVLDSFDCVWLRAFISATTTTTPSLLRGWVWPAAQLPTRCSTRKRSGRARSCYDPYQLDDRLDCANLVAVFAAPPMVWWPWRPSSPIKMRPLLDAFAEAISSA